MKEKTLWSESKLTDVGGESGGYLRRRREREGRLFGQKERVDFFPQPQRKRSPLGFCRPQNW